MTSPALERAAKISNSPGNVTFLFCEIRELWEYLDEGAVGDGVLEREEL